MWRMPCRHVTPLQRVTCSLAHTGVASNFNVSVRFGTNTRPAQPEAIPLTALQQLKART
jgi:hypothetical protein